jgi:hypothetical protein
MQMWPSAVSSRFSGFKSLWRRQADDMRLWVGQKVEQRQPGNRHYR